VSDLDAQSASPQATRPAVDRGRVAWLVAGGLALVGGTLLGWNAALLDAISRPPALLRAGLVAAAVLVGLWLVVTATRRLAESRVPAGELSGRDLVGLVRAVRLVFLAVAAFAAAGGWLVGHPLPFIVALVIAGVDILETSFLLLVVAVRRDP
jgi:hypothetical protein